MVLRKRAGRRRTRVVAKMWVAVLLRWSWTLWCWKAQQRTLEIDVDNGCWVAKLLESAIEDVRPRTQTPNARCRAQDTREVVERVQMVVKVIEGVRSCRRWTQDDGGAGKRAL